MPRLPLDILISIWDALGGRGAATDLITRINQEDSRND